MLSWENWTPPRNTPLAVYIPALNDNNPFEKDRKRLQQEWKNVFEALEYFNRILKYKNKSEWLEEYGEYNTVEDVDLLIMQRSVLESYFKILEIRMKRLIMKEKEFELA